MSQKNPIPIIIVTWNNEEDIAECLESIRQQTQDNHPVILVDNASTDKTLDIVREGFSEVTVVAQEENHFLSPSNNKGIKLAIEKYTPEYVLVLNPDTKLEPNLLEGLAAVLANEPKAAAAGPKVKFWKSKKEGKINSAGLIFDGFRQAYDRGFMEEDTGQFDQQKEVFGVTGACVMYRVTALQQAGFYWERIKMYLDEVELFIRLQKRGWKTLYIPKTTIWHAHMRSSNKQKSNFAEKKKMNAWLLIALRHYPLKSKLAMIKHYISSLFS